MPIPDAIFPFLLRRLGVVFNRLSDCQMRPPAFSRFSPNFPNWQPAIKANISGHQADHCFGELLLISWYSSYQQYYMCSFAPISRVLNAELTLSFTLPYFVLIIVSLVIFRSDPPGDTDKWQAPVNGFSYAVDLVKFIRSTYGDHFCIAVAGIFWI